MRQRNRIAGVKGQGKGLGGGGGGLGGGKGAVSSP